LRARGKDLASVAFAASVLVVLGGYAAWLPFANGVDSPVRVGQAAHRGFTPEYLFGDGLVPVLVAAVMSGVSAWRIAKVIGREA
jgi:hypothetical protein